VKVGFLEVVFLFGGSSGSSWRSGVIPRTITQTDGTQVFSTSHVLLDVVYKNDVENRTVGIKVTLFKSVYQDTRRRWNNFDVRVGNTILLEREVDFSFLCGSWDVVFENNFAQKGTSRVCHADQEEAKGDPDRCVDAILDGRKNGDQDSSYPNNEF